jgi:hypothetical protein
MTEMTLRALLYLGAFCTRCVYASATALSGGTTRYMWLLATVRRQLANVFIMCGDTLRHVCCLIQCDDDAPWCGVVWCGLGCMGAAVTSLCGSILQQPAVQVAWLSTIRSFSRTRVCHSRTHALTHSRTEILILILILILLLCRGCVVAHTGCRYREHCALGIVINRSGTKPWRRPAPAVDVRDTLFAGARNALWSHFLLQTNDHFA